MKRHFLKHFWPKTAHRSVCSCGVCTGLRSEGHRVKKKSWDLWACAQCATLITDSGPTCRRPINQRAIQSINYRKPCRQPNCKAKLTLFMWNKTENLLYLLINNVVHLKRLHDITDKLWMDISISYSFMKQLSNCALGFWTDFLRLVTDVQNWTRTCQMRWV